MASRLALYNFGMFRRPSGDPANRGFHDRNDPNLRAAEASDGFIARSGYPDEAGPPSWGVQVFPRFHVDNGDGWAPSTLSLWQDLASPMAFAYDGIHAEALSRAGDWFVRGHWPRYVIWWVAADHVPDWSEGVDRFEALHDHGPTRHAFDFKHAFDAAGNPVVVDRAAVMRKREANRAASAETSGTLIQP
jgi:hypothetical protein